jgi:choice-of-anchor B domain-containing protein
VGYFFLEDFGCGLPLFSAAGGSVTGFANDIWGWTSGRNQEIIIIGCTTGTSFIDVTNASEPAFIGFITAPIESFWSDIKVYQDHAYIGSEANGHGVFIVDLNTVAEDAANGLRNQTYTPMEIYTGLGNSHNIIINENTGYLYAVGSATCDGGLHILNISAPAFPVFVTCYSGVGYVHDAHCITYKGPDVTYADHEICLALTEEEITILDVTDKWNITVVSVSTYSDRGYAHQGWFSDSHTHFVMGDELDGIYS